MSGEKESTLSLEDLFGQMQEMVEQEKKENPSIQEPLESTLSFQEKIMEQFVSKDYLSLFEKISKSFPITENKIEEIKARTSVEFERSDFFTSVIWGFFFFVSFVIFLASSKSWMAMFLLITGTGAIISLMISIIDKLDKNKKNIERWAVNAIWDFSSKEEEMIYKIIPHIFMIYEINKRTTDQKLRKTLFSKLLDRNSIGEDNNLEPKEHYMRIKSMHKNFLNNPEVEELLKKDRAKVFENLLIKKKSDK